MCLAFAEQRIMTAQEAIREYQLAANEETKSSSGDKYETGRAMAQLEIEKNGVQLREAQKMKQALLLIDPEQQADTVQSGSLVITDREFFFIAIGAGALAIDEHDYFAISPASPIAKVMWGLKTNDSFSMNKRSYFVRKVL